jgi:hypothetical protein
LLAEYTASWSRFVGVINYRNRYERYFLGANLVHDIKFISIKDPQTLADFRATHDLSLQVDLSELPRAGTRPRPCISPWSASPPPPRRWP